MRIAFVAQPFDRMDPPVQASSLAIWIYQVARRCAQRGHDTFVFANMGTLLRGRHFRHGNVNYVHVPTGLNRVVNRAGDTVSPLLNRLRRRRSSVPSFAATWRDAGYGIEVGRRIRRLRCDAVLVMNCSQLVPIIRKINPLSKIYLYMQCEWLTQLDREVIRRRMLAADLVGGCSEYITRTISTRYPEFRDSCVTLTNAASPASDPDESFREPHNVLFVGRVSPEKGIHVLVDAFRTVLRRFPTARLHIVGGAGSAPLEYLVALSNDPHVADLRRFYECADGDNDPYLWHLEKAAGEELGKRIIFHGAIDYDGTVAVYRRASVLVNPSLSESFGMTLVEGMMHRVPVVATKVGGMPYIVSHGETGLLVNPADADALATAICAVLADERKASEMGEAGRLRALRKFTWESTTETLLRQFERLQMRPTGGPCSN